MELLYTVTSFLVQRSLEDIEVKDVNRKQRTKGEEKRMIRRERKASKYNAHFSTYFLHGTKIPRLE
jgi:hypothetical protein